MALHCVEPFILNSIIMKTYFLYLLILCSILSCSKSSDVTPATGTSYVSMKINGVEWKSSIGAGAITSGSFSGTGALEVTGGKDVLAMTLINAANVGTTYKFEETNDRLLQFSRSASKVSGKSGPKTQMFLADRFCRLCDAHSRYTHFAFSLFRPFVNWAAGFLFFTGSLQAALVTREFKALQLDNRFKIGPRADVGDDFNL